MKNKFKKLEPLVHTFQEEIEAVETRRLLWTERTLPLIRETFTEFIKHFKLDATISEDNQIAHHGSLFLSFEERPSGMVVRKNNQTLIRHGGGLLFTQEANGKVATFIIEPFIEGMKGKKGAHKQLETHKPEQISEKLNIDYLQKFYRELLEWECFLRQPIGFNH